MTKGVPVSLYSGQLLSKVGYDRMVTAMFTVYSLKMLGLPQLSPQSPWGLFGLEMLKPFGNNLAMITATHFIMANTGQQNIASLEVSRFHFKII